MTDKKVIKQDVDIKPTANIFNDWSVSKLFWGLFLILIGGLAFASNLGLIEVNFANLWRLWPLMIIASGLSILAPRNLTWKIITIIFAIMTLCAAAWVIVGNYPDLRPVKTYNATVQRSSEAVRQANISIKTGASTLNINSTNQESVAKLKLESNVSTLLDESSVVDGIQQIVLSTKTNNGKSWFVGDVRNLWNIDFTQNLPINLNIETGASSNNIDLSLAKLKNLNLKTGASSLTVKVGNIEDLVQINIESGVSSIVVKVPQTSGIDLRLDNGLTDNNLADLKKINENNYQSSGYTESTEKVNIVSKIGLSTFTIERY